MQPAKSWLRRVWDAVSHICTAIQVWQLVGSLAVATGVGVWAFVSSLPPPVLAVLVLAAGTFSIWISIGFVWWKERRKATVLASLSPPPITSHAPQPSEIKPVKRRGIPKANGEYDIYLCLTIQNKTGRPVEDCTGRLVSVHEDVDTPDGAERRIISNLYPVYLQWSMADGGGRSKSFVKEATLDVAAAESWDSPVFQIITAEERLRPSYRLEHQYPTLNYYLTIEISAMSGGWLSESYLLRRWHTRVHEHGEPSIDFYRF